MSMIQSPYINNMFVYCGNNASNNSDPLGFFDVGGAVKLISASAIFNMFVNQLMNSLSTTLLKISAYVTKILLPKVAAICWWNPWVVAGIVVGAVAIVCATVLAIYNAHVAKINKENGNKTVKEILKTKKGSIKNAPLPPGGPHWDDILFMTLNEIQRLARGDSGWHAIYKLLTDGRFNK